MFMMVYQRSCLFVFFNACSERTRCHYTVVFVFILFWHLASPEHFYLLLVVGYFVVRSQLCLLQGFEHWCHSVLETPEWINDRERRLVLLSESPITWPTQLGWRWRTSMDLLVWSWFIRWSSWCQLYFDCCWFIVRFDLNILRRSHTNILLFINCDINCWFIFTSFKIYLLS